MINNIKKVIILIALVTSTIILTSCGRKDQFIPDYDYIVTMDAMGGKMGNYDYRAIYVMENSIVVEPGTNTVPEVLKQSHSLIGWFLGEKLTDGSVNYGKQWNFSLDRVTSDITLYAKWQLNYTVTARVGDQFQDAVVIMEFSEKSSIIKRPSSIKLTTKPTSDKPSKDYTVIEYYADEKCTIPFQFGVSNSFKDKDGNDVYNLDIYTKWLLGNYRLISIADHLKEIKSNDNLYFMNDIDLSGYDVKLPSTFTGTILGNNFTIRNLNVKQQQSGLNDFSFGILGDIEKATIQDITFDACSYTIDVGITSITKYYVGFLAGRVRGESVISNVTIKNTKVIIKTDLLPNIFQTGVLCGFKSAAVKVENVSDEMGTNIEFSTTQSES